MFGPIEFKSTLELVRPHISILRSDDQVSLHKTLKTRASSAQFNFPGTRRLCESKSIGGSVSFVTSVPPHSSSSKAPGFVLPPALSPDRGVPGYNGSRPDHCSARGSGGYSPLGPETSSAASPRTKTSWAPPQSGSWGGREDGRRWVGERKSCSATNQLGDLIEWVSEGRAEGHSPARMDGEILAHVSHQLWGPVGPDALGGPGLGRPSQPLVPDLGKEKPWNSPGTIHHHHSGVQRGTVTWCHYSPIPSNLATNPLGSLENWSSEKAYDFKVNSKSSSEPRSTPRSPTPT